MAKPVYALVNGVWTLVGSTTAHTHTNTDVTGLQAALDAKANLTSPTFTGTLTADTVKITGGTPGVGKVLTSGADGDATWEAVSGGGGVSTWDAGTQYLNGDVVYSSETIWTASGSPSVGVQPYSIDPSAYNTDPGTQNNENLTNPKWVLANDGGLTTYTYPSFQNAGASNLEPQYGGFQTTDTVWYAFTANQACTLSIDTQRSTGSSGIRDTYFYLYTAATPTPLAGDLTQLTTVDVGGTFVGNGDPAFLCYWNDINLTAGTLYFLQVGNAQNRDCNLIIDFRVVGGDILLPGESWIPSLREDGAFKGAWGAATAYAEGDTVTHNSSLWGATSVPAVADEPGVAAAWSEIRAGVQPGDDANTLGSGAATDGFVLKADGTGGTAWEAESGGSVTTMDDLSDVDLTTTTPTNGQALVYLGAVAEPCPELTYLDTYSTGSDLTTYTASGLDFGAEDADRTLIAVWGGRCFGVDNGTPVVSIGGVTATIDVFSTYSDSDTSTVVIARAHVPTGTNGDVAVTFGTGYTRAGVQLFSVPTQNLTVVDSGAGGAVDTEALSLPDVSTTNGGLMLVAAAYNSSSSGATATWGPALLAQDAFARAGTETLYWGLASGETDGTDAAPSVGFSGTANLEQAIVSVTYSLPSGGGAWVPGDVAELDDLTDVDTSTTAPTDGQALVWDNGNSQWVPGDLSSHPDATGRDAGEIAVTDGADGWTYQPLNPYIPTAKGSSVSIGSVVNLPIEAEEGDFCLIFWSSYSTSSGSAIDDTAPAGFTVVPGGDGAANTIAGSDSSGDIYIRAASGNLSATDISTGSLSVGGISWQSSSCVVYPAGTVIRDSPVNQGVLSLTTAGGSVLAEDGDIAVTCLAMYDGQNEDIPESADLDFGNVINYTKSGSSNARGHGIGEFGVAAGQVMPSVTWQIATTTQEKASVAILLGVAPVDTGIQQTLFDAKGDLLVASAADTAAVLTAGTDGQVLAADSAEAAGLKWIDPAAAGMTSYQGVWSAISTYNENSLVHHNNKLWIADGGAVEVGVEPGVIDATFNDSILALTPALLIHGTANANDTSGNGRNATATGSITYGVPGVDSNQVMRLNGASYLTVAYGAWMEADSISLIALVKTTTGGSLMCRQDSDTGAQSYRLTLSNASGVASVFIRYGSFSSYHTVSGTTDLRDNNWHLIVATRTGAQTTIYVDGIEEGAASAGSSIYDSSQSLLIGAQDDDPPANFFNGDLAVAITGVLTAPQVAQLAADTLSAPNLWVELSPQNASTPAHTIENETTPVAQRTNLNFTGSGVTVTDDSGNDRTVVTIPGGGIQTSLFDAKGDLLVASAADTAAVLTAGTDDQVLVTDSTQATGLKWEDKPSAYLPVFYQSGVLTPGTGTNRWYNDTTKPINIVALRCSVESAPVGSDIGIDFLVDDAIAASLTITDGTTTSGKTAASITIPVNSYVTIDIISVGSTTPGTGLGITSAVS